MPHLIRLTFAGSWLQVDDFRTRPATGLVTTPANAALAPGRVRNPRRRNRLRRRRGVSSLRMRCWRGIHDASGADRATAGTSGRRSLGTPRWVDGGLISARHQGLPSWQSCRPGGSVVDVAIEVNARGRVEPGDPKAPRDFVQRTPECLAGCSLLLRAGGAGAGDGLWAVPLQVLFGQPRPLIVAAGSSGSTDHALGSIRLVRHNNPPGPGTRDAWVSFP